MQTTHSQTWREITIGPGLIDQPPSTDPTVTEVRRVLAEASAAGMRTVLLHMDGDGGRVDSAFAMYRDLRAFSDAGGTVVAHVREYAASTATMVLLAADVIVMDEAARLIVHSMIGGTPEQVRAANAAVQAVYEARTTTRPDALALWLSLYDNDRGDPFFADLRLEAALAGGWADLGGSVDDARQVAQWCAAGRPFFSERRHGLQRRDQRAAVACPEELGALVGAKMRQNAAGQAPAFLVDPAGMKVGQRTLSEAWLGAYQAFACQLSLYNNGGTLQPSITNILNCSSCEGATWGIVINMTLAPGSGAASFAAITPANAPQGNYPSTLRPAWYGVTASGQGYIQFWNGGTLLSANFGIPVGTTYMFHVFGMVARSPFA